MLVDVAKIYTGYFRDTFFGLSRPLVICMWSNEMSLLVLTVIATPDSHIKNRKNHRTEEYIKITRMFFIEQKKGQTQNEIKLCPPIPHH